METPAHETTEGSRIANLGPSSDEPMAEVESKLNSFPTIVPLEHDYADEKYYVRECYPEYYTAAMELLNKQGGVSISGTPGIGKSLFMAYFFERYSRENPDHTVFMIAYSGPNSVLRKAVVAKGGREATHAYDVVAMNALMRQYVEPQPRNEVIVLVDGVPPTIPVDVRWVAFAAPRVAWRTTLLENSTVCSEVFLPMWDIEELVAAARALARRDLLKPVSEEEQMDMGLGLDDVDGYESDDECEHEGGYAQSVVNKRLEIFGGVARWCLAPSKSTVRTAYVWTRAEWAALTPTVVETAMRVGLVPDNALNVLHYWPLSIDLGVRVMSTTSLEDELMKRMMPTPATGPLKVSESVPRGKCTRRMGMSRRRSIALIVLLSVVALWVAHATPIRVVHSLDEVVASVERARHVSAVLLVSSRGDATLKDLADENQGRGDDDALVRALQAQFPHVPKIAQSLAGAVDFVVADIADAKAVTKKWNVAGLPALVVYKDAPKKNPYTGEMYRDAALVPVTVLQQPRELKKLLRESIPAIYVTEWSALSGVTSLADVEAQRKDTKQALVVLLSKQTAASPLFRALSVEFDSRGLAFAYVNHEEAVAQEAMSAWGVENLPAIVVVKSHKHLDDRVVFQDESAMRTYADLKALVEPYATAVEEESLSGDVKSTDEKKAAKPDMPMLTSANFDAHVLESKLVWIVSFMDAETEASTDKKEWRKMMNDIQKKSGIVAVGAVNCAKDAELCEKYGGAGTVRVFPITQHATTGEIERGDLFEEVFKTVEDAKQPAIDSLPDVVRVMGSAAELNAFISRALIDKAMPVLLVTSKMETPPILKSLALSFPSQHIAVGVVSDLDPQVKQMFNLAPSSKSSFLSLIAVDEKTRQAEGQPANAAPFGVILYDKKTMGPFTYPNMVRYLMSVLTQYPHPKPQLQTGESEAEFAFGPGDDSAAVDGDVPYLREDNLDTLCSGNKICAIGFFEGHVDTLNDEDSPLSKAIGVLSQVAAKSRKARQPFHFMWTNGKCQSAFAESFGVGTFQMPTVVVYSPSKARYATNIGVFDENNTAGFLKGVLLGKIATTPVNEVASLRNECLLEEITDSAAGGVVEDENDEDLGDLLSEILGDEEEQRRQLQEELAKERKAAKKDSAKKDKKKKKKKGKKKDRDEL